MGNSFAAKVRRTLDPTCLVIKKAQVVAHKTHQPDFILDLLHSHSLTGEGLAEINLQRSHTDPATAGNRDGVIMEGIFQIW